MARGTRYAVRGKPKLSGRGLTNVFIGEVQSGNRPRVSGRSVQVVEIDQKMFSLTLKNL